ncbi:septum formation initiator family protein [bacterium]|nr:septum formation initiator family protein [candidate division CSSED10-310 bacterium]
MRNRLSLFGLIAAWIFIGLLILQLVFGPAGLLANRDLRQRIRQTEADIERLQTENERLQKEIEYRRSADYLEELARAELRKVLPGETLVLFPTPSIGTPGADASLVQPESSGTPTGIKGVWE